MVQTTNERMKQLLDQLNQFPGQAENLPGQEGEMVRDALRGQSVYEIAQTYRVAEGAVWNILSSVARDLSGQPPRQPAETGGLGSDTDPGVTGGYGDTGFGSLGNEPPMPSPEEPAEPEGPDEQE